MVDVEKRIGRAVAEVDGRQTITRRPLIDLANTAANRGAQLLAERHGPEAEHRVRATGGAGAGQVAAFLLECALQPVDEIERLLRQVDADHGP